MADVLLSRSRVRPSWLPSLRGAVWLGMFAGCGAAWGFAIWAGLQVLA